MRAVVLGILGGLLLGVSAVELYEGVAVGMLSCTDRHMSAMCETNYVRTAWAEAGVALGALACVGALWFARRSQRKA